MNNACFVATTGLFGRFPPVLSEKVQFGVIPFRCEKGEEKLRGLQLLKATATHCVGDRRQLLVIPLTMWSGVEQGFFGADFTAGFIRQSAFNGHAAT